MARDVGWWLGRLRAMSFPEVAHRCWRLVRYPIDVARARTGTYGRMPRGLEHSLVRWRGPERFYFDAHLASGPTGREVIDAAESCLAGRRAVIGLGEIQLPADPWHFEPHAAAWWPRIDAGRVIASAPDSFDPRLTWEINRGHEWVLLARAHSATGDRRFRIRLASELESWLRQNPVGIGINWASAMEAAIRIHSLAWVAGLLRGDLDVAFWRLLADAIYRHVAFVASNRSRFSSANNHLIVELSGLIVGARVLGLSGKLAKLHREAIRELVRAVLQQMHADGVNAEMATHYHMFVLEALLLVAFIERVHGQPTPELTRVSHRMADYLSAVSCADGAVLQQGDNDDGKLVPLLARHHARQLVQSAAVLNVSLHCHSDGRTSAAGSPYEGVQLLTGGKTVVEPELPASPRSRIFVPSGQVVLRGQRLHVVLDAGPFGFGSLAAHAHCDALAVAVAIDGRRFLIDRGTFRYNGDRGARDRFRMTAAHNTVQVGSREQGDAIGSFLWSRRPQVRLERCELTDQGDVVEASHDGFSPVQHRRTLVRVTDILMVIDSIANVDVHERVVARWHLAPELEFREGQVEPVMPIQVGHFARTDVLGWLWALVPEHDLVWRRLTTWHSDLYAARTEAASMECELGPGAERCAVTLIGPGRPTQFSQTILSAVQFAAARGSLSATAADALRTSLGVRLEPRGGSTAAALARRT